MNSDRTRHLASGSHHPANHAPPRLHQYGLPKAAQGMATATCDALWTHDTGYATLTRIMLALTSALAAAFIIAVSGAPHQCRAT